MISLYTCIEYTDITQDTTYPKINMDSFPQFDWTKFYGYVEEIIPVDIP